MAEPVQNLLPSLSSRREYFDYLDRWTVGTVDHLRAHMTGRALVKAYLLETSRADGDRDPLGALAALGQRVTRVDETLHTVQAAGESEDWALVEVEDERYPVLYTALESKVADDRIDNLVFQSAAFDRAWFAAPMFNRLWDVVLQAFPDHRYTQFVFEYESAFETSPDALAGSNEGDDSEVVGSDDQEDHQLRPERRRARMQISERLGKLRDSLLKMRENYEPLESVVRLRVPAPIRGGHDVYFDGKFTNRADSVTSLRQTVELVTAIYRHSTEGAEAAAWPQSSDILDRGRPLSLGAPLLIKFNAPLEQATFDRWMAVLRRKNNRFRLWGNPIEMGPGKVHLYAVDHHLWQTIDLEITREHLYALLPSGTCGNTIHRLVANIQRFVDPKLSSYIGDRPYASFLQDAPLTVSRG